MAKDSSFYLKFGARFQNLASGEWSLSQNGIDSEFESNLLVRRSRLKFDGFAFSPKLIYKLELGLSNRDIGGGGNAAEFNRSSNVILDAFLEWNFAKNFYLRFGQGKLAGNRERVISSGNLQLVDRSRLNSRFNIDRDFGIQITHISEFGEEFKMIKKFSISQGEGRDVTGGSFGGFDYTARVELLPFGTFQSKGDYVGSSIKREKSPKLSLGASFDYNRNAVRERGQLGSFVKDAENNYFGKNLSTIFLDLMYKHKGLSIMAEYAHKNAENDNPVSNDLEGNEVGTFYTGSGINVQMGHIFADNWEWAIRYTKINPDEEVDEGETQYTIGLNKFIVGHKLKVQTDITYRNFSLSQDRIQFRFQTEMHF
jgi:hypothetical protein